MKTKIDTQNWSRKDYFTYFGAFDDPFFGVVVNVDCTTAYSYCKKHGISFFLYYMYESAKAVNMVENFRLRLIDGDVYLFDCVHPSTTVGRKDNSFGFALFEYTDDFESFSANAKEKIAEVQTYSGLRIEENARRVDVVHCTTVPWFSFTGAKHEKSIRNGDSIPKFAYGKFFEQDGRKLMPVSINAHHGLVDGYHVAKYLELFQAGLNRGR